MVTHARTQPMEGREQTNAHLLSTAITPATDLHDALSVQCDKIRTMRCRKNPRDALSVRMNP
jgi:hypothetical protein